MSMTPTEAKDLAIVKAGGVTKLSLAIGVTRSAVSQWDKVPSGRVLAVEKISGVSRCLLRPDTYPPQESAA